MAILASFLVDLAAKNGDFSPLLRCFSVWISSVSYLFKVPCIQSVHSHVPEKLEGGGGLPTLCQVLTSRDPAARRGADKPLRHAALRWTSYRVWLRSMEMRTFNQRSAMARRARPWEWPQARSAAYLFLLAASQTMLVRDQW